jgi:hypothetical protein
MSKQSQTEVKTIAPKLSIKGNSNPPATQPKPTTKPVGHNPNSAAVPQNGK